MKVLRKLKVDLNIAPIEYFGIFLISTDSDSFEQTL